MSERGAGYLRANHGGPRRQDRRTPRPLFDALHAEFGFTLDAAASIDNHLCDRYYTEADDGLRQDWAGDAGGGAVYVNPPFATAGAWIAKAAATAAAGTRVVMVLPVRTGTAAWHASIFGNPRAEIRFLLGRLNYDGDGGGAPFDSAIVIFHPPAGGDA